MPKTYLITGGAGFIGSNFVHYLLWAHPDAIVVNIDALSYAGNLENLADIASHPQHVFIQADIRDRKALDAVFGKYGPDYVVNFAAQSHVDRSIADPTPFVSTNIGGTLSLLEAACHDWEEPDGSFGQHVFLQVSSDEVYGTRPLSGDSPLFSEESPLAPRNPYSASKAAADHYVMAYAHAYGLPVMIARCANNYGPFQHPEKLIPMAIANALAGQEIGLYGDGRNIRDWIYVADTCRAIDLMLQHGMPGQTYNVSASCEKRNIDVVAALANELGRQTEGIDCNTRFIPDRKGHDERYGMNAAKLRHELGWTPSTSFANGIRKTVYWYLENQDWTGRVLAGDVDANNQRLLAEWGAAQQAAKKQERKEAAKEAKAQEKAAKREARHSKLRSAKRRGKGKAPKQPL